MLGAICYAYDPATRVMGKTDNDSYKGNLKHADFAVLRDLAAHVQAYDLDKKIAVEQRLHDAARQMIAKLPADHSQVSLEAAKSLMVSELRLSSYRDALLTRKKACAGQSKGSVLPTPGPSVAKVAVADLRIPLMWKGKDHQRNRSKCYAIFALLRLETDICETELVYGVDSTATDVSFGDMFVFENVAPSSSLAVDVYGCPLHESSHSAAGGSFHLKRKLKGSLSRSIGSKLGAMIKRQLEEDAAMQFTKLASGHLTISDPSDGVRIVDLTVCCNGTSEDYQFCFYGHLSCKVSIQPTSTVHALREGWLTVQTKSQPPRQLWFSLKLGLLRGWDSPEQAETTPRFCLPLTQSCSVWITPDASLILQVPKDGGVAQFSIRAQVQQDAHVWKEAFEKQIIDCGAWGVWAQRSVEVRTPPPAHYRLKPVGRSLYDEISMSEPPAREPLRHLSQWNGGANPTKPSADLNSSYQMAVGQLPRETTLVQENAFAGRLRARQSVLTFMDGSKELFL